MVDRKTYNGVLLIHFNNCSLILVQNATDCHLSCIIHKLLPRRRQVTKDHKVIKQGVLKLYSCLDSSQLLEKLNIFSILCNLVPLGLFVAMNYPGQKKLRKS